MGRYEEDKFQQEIIKLKKTDFFRLAELESRPRIRTRLLALGHLRDGKSKRQVIDMFDIVFPTLREWLLRFLAEGLDGLEDRVGKGRKRKLPPAQEKKFIQQLEELRKSRRDGRLKALDAKTILKEQFGIEHALPSVYHILGRFGIITGSIPSKGADKRVRPLSARLESQKKKDTGA